MRAIWRRARRRLPRARILETAAGTGAVTAALLDAVPDAEIVATDLNQAMLDVAAAAIRRPNCASRRPTRRRCRSPDASFDLVVCQFGVMFFPDRVAAYREARRVLSPGRAFPVQRLGPDRGQSALRGGDRSGRRALSRAIRPPSCAGSRSAITTSPGSRRICTKPASRRSRSRRSRSAAEAARRARPRPASATAARCAPRSRRAAASTRPPTAPRRRSPASKGRTGSTRRCRRSW